MKSNSTRNQNQNEFVIVTEACKAVSKYVAIFSFLINFLMLAAPIYSLQVLDRVISSGSIPTLTILFIITLVAILGMGALQIIRSFLLIKVSNWFDGKLSTDLIGYTISKASYNKNMDGGIYHRELGNVKQFITGPALTAIFDAPWSIVFIIVLFLIHWLLGTVAMIAGLLLFCFALLNEYLTKKPLSQANEFQVKSNHVIDIATRNAEVIEAMGMMDNVVKNWKKKYSKAFSLQNLASQRGSIINLSSRSVRMIIQITVMGVGAYLALSNEITIGAIIASSILVGRALAPFEAAIAAWKGAISARNSYNKLKGHFATNTLREEAMEIPEPKGEVSVESVSFIPFGSDKPTLVNISLSMKPGEIIAVIGPSAAGKSTLAKIISGVWKPVKGIVRLDGADIYRWQRKDVNKYLGYLPQDIELFDGTVKENIARMDQDADPEEVVKAAKIAGIHDLVLRLPKGYETEIGIGGSVLSAGQRQRIALARVFFGDPKVIILDEPNSNLDSEGEGALLKAVVAAKQKNIAVIIISHRKSIVSVVDKILLIKEGQLAEFGEKDKILKKFSNKNIIEEK